jgi:hypothetical protein
MLVYSSGGIQKNGKKLRKMLEKKTKKNVAESWSYNGACQTEIYFFAQNYVF